MELLEKMEKPVLKDRKEWMVQMDLAFMLSIQ